MQCCIARTEWVQWVLNGNLRLQKGVEPTSCWRLPWTTTRTAPAAWSLPPALPLAILPSIFCPNPCHRSKPFYDASSSLQEGSMCRSSKWYCEACRWGHVGTVGTAGEHRGGFIVDYCRHWPPPIFLTLDPVVVVGQPDMK